jgi:hypothetical protein
MSLEIRAANRCFAEVEDDLGPMVRHHPCEIVELTADADDVRFGNRCGDGLRRLVEIEL